VQLQALITQYHATSPAALKCMMRLVPAITLSMHGAACSCTRANARCTNMTSGQWARVAPLQAHHAYAWRGCGSTSTSCIRRMLAYCMDPGSFANRPQCSCPAVASHRLLLTSRVCITLAAHPPAQHGPALVVAVQSFTRISAVAGASLFIHSCTPAHSCLGLDNSFVLCRMAYDVLASLWPFKK
jgi:hypothetical protein